VSIENWLGFILTPKLIHRLDIKSAGLPESLYFIISLSDPDQPVIRGFSIIEGEVSETELRITET